MYQPFADNINVLDSMNQNDNILVFSSVSAFYEPVRSKGFAVKYVVEGVERYTLNGQKYPVETGKYLLSNNTTEGYVEIESGKNVKGICINIVPDLLAEIVASHQRPDTAFTDPALGCFFSSNLFLEQQYNAQNTQVGQFLMNLAQSVQHQHFNKNQLSIEFFYQLSEKIIADQIPVFKQLQAIPSVKPSTKKDLLQRVYRGKELMDASFIAPLHIAYIAQEACMSEYHFFRLFKLVFGISPNQYLIQKRLERGYFILKQDRDSVTTAAIASGFSDIFTFSKAFKKQFGCAPSAISK
jgi:AraC family transcriptional regulator